ncbi:MAG: acetyl-CoA carboxylase biotin carboxylase subunit [Vulcanimicrobiaceae bacterium]
MDALTRAIRRVLIANRGEIAVRIARAARAEGIAPLGVYSDADARAMHVDAMDDAVDIGAGPASESYLDAERIVAAARTLRADAVHPGYGFLSERASFARAVLDADLIFVGPRPDAIAALGDKTEARRRARAVDVAVLPGYDGEDLTLATLQREADRIGLPVLIKARGGGGGRGMRVVRERVEFADALAAARHEALAAFGDDRVLLERYVERSRHIEFQIAGDDAGTVVHLGERECSIQRRHQKIVEEAPSPALDADLRARMASAAIAIARAVAYTNVGTVEFLLDERRDFYFLEMNARLQVEHPVTECVTGIDIVRLQFTLASGASMPFAQTDIATRGWAIEARLTAEDPATGYLPVSGAIARFDLPQSAARIDAGVRDGSIVSTFYDALLAKVIVAAPTREAAIVRLDTTLARARVDGIATNVPLLRAILADDAFVAGTATTAFLADRPHLLAPQARTPPDDAFALAIGALLLRSRAWRIANVGIPLRLRSGERTIAVRASLVANDTWSIRGDLTWMGRIQVSDERVVVHPGGRRVAGRVAFDDDGASHPLRIDVTLEDERYALHVQEPPVLGTRRTTHDRGDGTIVSPMPGKVLAVRVAAGDRVAARDVLVVLEAMKMEHRIEAAHAGIVARIAVACGDSVARGATLVEFAASVAAESTHPV